MKIPILNLYYLISYASGIINPDHKEVVIGLDDNYSIADLYSRLMIVGVDGVLKRGLYREYINNEDEIFGIRGRIAFAETIRKRSFHHGKTVCSFDELSENVLANQVIKATLIRLVKTENLENDLKNKLLYLIRRLGHVSNIELDFSIFRKLVIHRNMSRYRILLFVSKLIYDQTSASEDGNNVRFLDIEKDERKLAKLFEEFVRKFYEVELTEYKIARRKLNWSFISDTDSIIPEMETDIPLESKDNIFIIDTKYYAALLKENQYGQSKVHSSHMYQMFAYMEHYPNPNNKKLVGVLLYPRVDKSYNIVTKSSTNHLHQMRFRSLDLSVPWHEIRQDLLNLIYE